jgi:hypothetical protein
MELIYGNKQKNWTMQQGLIIYMVQDICGIYLSGKSAVNSC